MKLHLTEGVFGVEEPLSGGLIPVALGRRRRSPASHTLHGAALRGWGMRTEGHEAGERGELRWGVRRTPQRLQGWETEGGCGRASAAPTTRRLRRQRNEPQAGIKAPFLLFRAGTSRLKPIQKGQILIGQRLSQSDAPVPRAGHVTWFWPMRVRGRLPEADGKCFIGS